MNPFCAERPLRYMHPKHLTVETLIDEVQAGESLQIIDVRSLSEFESGHIPGAIHIPMETIQSRMEDLDLHRPTVLVCHSGNRAEITCQQVQDRFDNVRVLEGGTASWCSAGNKVVKTTASGKSLMHQALIGAGIVNATGVLLALFAHPGWIGLSAFVSVGLIVAGSTGFCLMAMILSKMPWNRRPRTNAVLADNQV